MYNEIHRNSDSFILDLNEIPQPLEIFHLVRNVTFSSSANKSFYIIYRRSTFMPMQLLLSSCGHKLCVTQSQSYRLSILHISSDVKNRFPMVQFGKTFGPANLISKRRYKMLFERRG